MTRPPPRLRLSTGTKLGYALGDHTVNVALASIGFLYLHFLTDVVGLRPLLASFVRWIGPCVDAFTDPIMGRLSDRTRWRAGRRRPYFLIGILPLGLSFAWLWWPAPFDSEAARFFFYAAAYAVFGVSVTIVAIPYMALIPEMARDYQERTSVHTFRSGGAMLGVGVAVLLLPLAKALGGGAPGYAWAGLAMAAWLALPWLVVHAVSFEVPGYQRPATQSFRSSLRALLRHRAYRIVAGLYLCSRVAVDLVTGLMLFYFEDWLGRPEDFELTMGCFIAGLVLALPVWLRVSRFVEKRTLFRLGAGVWIAVQACFLAADPDWSRALVFALGALVGAAYGAVEMMPWSMLADVVDEDEVASGERREGLYSGLFMFLRKLAGPTAIVGVGAVLEASGYTGTGPTSETAAQAIRWLTALGPIAFLALAFVLAGRYPLDRAAHERLRSELEARRATAP